jgi:hypothetical protein
VTVLALALWALTLAVAPSTETRSPAGVIAVVAPPGSDPAVLEALSRFRGEAASVGFEVTVVPGSAAAPPSSQMEAAADAVSAVATVAFVNGGDPHALDVWFTDRSTGQTVLGHVSVENEAGDRSSVVLAVKAVDFLRARMFDFLVARPKSLGDAQARSAASRSATAPIVASDSSGDSLGARRLGLTIGIGALRSLQDLGTTFLPLLRVSYDVTSWSSLRITLGGLGTASRVDVMGGSATVREELAMGEWAVMPGRARVRPMLSVGLGAHDIRAEGSAVAPYAARDSSLASLAVALSAGLRLSITRRLAVSAEVGAFLLFPEPQILIAGLEGGRTGRPGLSAVVALDSRF